MAVDPKAPPLPLVMQYPVLPVVIRPRSPEDVELEMRLLSAARLDAPEAIAEVQSIAAEHAGMISVAKAADAIIEEAQSVNAALLRARKAAKRATPEALAAKAAKKAAKAEAAAAKAAKTVKPEALEAIVQQALDAYNLLVAISVERVLDIQDFVNSTLRAKGMNKVGRPSLLAALRTLRQRRAAATGIWQKTALRDNRK